MGAARIYLKDLIRGYPTQSDFCEGRYAFRGLCFFYEMLRHNIPRSHVYCMILEAGKFGSVRLTLKIVQSWNKPFILVYPSEGVEKIMGKHTQMGIFCRHTDAAPECLAPFCFHRHIHDFFSYT